MGDVERRTPSRPPKHHEETPGMRNRACCHAEPECMLCPLRPENVERSLQELWDAGLYANLPKLGFGKHRD